MKTRVAGMIVEKPTTFYGQLHYILQAVLPANPKFGIREEYQGLLALVSLTDAKGDATYDRVWYTKLKKPEFLHVGTIQCVIGRVRVGNRWGVIDTSLYCERTRFVDDSDDEDER